jgi:hypothetical protein
MGKISNLQLGRKQTIVIVTTLLSLFLVVFTSYNYVIKTKEDSNNENKNDNKETVKTLYFYENENYGIYYKEEEDPSQQLLGVYNCESEECYEYAAGTFEYRSLEDMSILLKDGNNIFLYDIKNQKKISENYELFMNIYKDDYSTFAFVVIKNGQEGIVDTKGKILVPLEYEAVGDMMPIGELFGYDAKKNYILAKKNGKYGVITITEGNKILNFLYEYVEIQKTGNFVILDGELWYAIDKDNDMVLGEGYDYIKLFDDFAVVVKDNEMQIINYRSEKIVDDSIATYMEHDRYACCAVPVGFYISDIEDDIVSIYIDYDYNEVSGEYETYEYEYNIIDNKITKIN